MSKVQFCRTVGRSAVISLVYFMDGDAQARMVMRGTSIIDVGGVAGGRRAYEE